MTSPDIQSIMQREGQWGCPGDSTTDGRQNASKECCECGDSPDENAPVKADWSAYNRVQWQQKPTWIVVVGRF